MPGKNTLTSKRFFFSLIYVLVCVIVQAQNLKFKRVSIDAGLSAISVNTVFQDSEGFTWIGTQDGLNRYDGYHIKTFKANQYSKQSISSNYISCLFEDEQGDIYVGTNGGGISVFNKITET